MSVTFTRDLQIQGHAYFYMNFLDFACISAILLYQENVDIDLHILGTEDFEKNILDHVTQLRDLL